jgi:hypothetical protein
MRVQYCHGFSQNTVLEKNTVPQNTALEKAVPGGRKGISSLKQNLAEEARVSQGEETRQLAPKSSSNHVRPCLNAKSLTATFQFVSGGSS